MNERSEDTTSLDLQITEITLFVQTTQLRQPQKVFFKLIKHEFTKKTQKSVHVI